MKHRVYYIVNTFLKQSYCKSLIMWNIVLALQCLVQYQADVPFVAKN